MSHVITIQPPFDGTCIYICCSCSDEPIAKVGYPEAPASLVEVNEIAHRHIECSERYDRIREQAKTTWGPVGILAPESERLDPRDLRNDTAWNGSTYGV